MTRTSQRARNRYLDEADRLIILAEKTTNPADKHRYLRRAAEAFRRCDCEAAALTADREAMKALGQ